VAVGRRQCSTGSPRAVCAAIGLCRLVSDQAIRCAARDRLSTEPTVLVLWGSHTVLYLVPPSQWRRQEDGSLRLCPACYLQHLGSSAHWLLPEDEWSI
jgi:hypothetical protein